MLYSQRFINGPHHGYTNHCRRRGVGHRELVLHNPLQVDLNSGMIIGGQAWVRWRDPVHSLAPLDRFIGLAEDTGAFCRSGDRILKQCWQNEVL